MRNILLCIFLLLASVVHAQFVVIPDPDFRNKLIQLYPACFNGLQQMDTTCAAIVNATSLNVSNSNIDQLDGIRYFDALEYLNAQQNQLSTFPVFPPGLRTLIIWANMFTGALPPLPDSLENLDCYSNAISSLPPLPSTLRSLNCGNTHLTFLPALPAGLEALYCQGDDYYTFPELYSLPTLPPSLDTLVVPNQSLSEIPPLPDGLRYLNCHRNLLKRLPKLPPALTFLSCGRNRIFRLPVLPPALKIMLCDTTRLTHIPQLPDGFTDLFCPDNLFLTCVSALPQSLQTLTYNSTPLTCIPNLVNGNNFGLPLCPPNSSCKSGYNASGTVFLDVNANGIYDIGTDSALANCLVGNSTGWADHSQADGGYVLNLDSGVVNVLNLYNPYYSTTPSAYTITPTGLANPWINHDFAVQLIPNIHDLRVDIAKGPARPGFEKWVHVTIQNAGTENETGATLKMKKPSPFLFLNADPPISQLVGDTLFWYNIDLDIFKDKHFNVKLQVPANQIIGSGFQLKAWIVPPSTDTTPYNNYVQDDGTVVGSFDPNDKAVSRKTLDINGLDELLYTVRFQNTGTDTAFNIMVRDELSELLDLTTFRMISASHGYSYQLRDKGILEVLFQDVMLVDSNTNEPESHGFFQFGIRPKPGLALNDSVTNTAAIYFDFNAPVITNTTVTKVIVAGVLETDSQYISMYPNPVSSTLRIMMDEKEGELLVSDSRGAIQLKTKIRQGGMVDLGSLSPGIYLVRIITSKGIRTTRIVKSVN